MKNRVGYKGIVLAEFSLYLLIILIFLPIAMTIPSFIRMPLQVLSIVLFICSLICLNKSGYLVAFCILSLISYLYYIGSWNEIMTSSTFLYNSICCWQICIYSFMCLDKSILFNNNRILHFAIFIVCITVLTTIAGLLEYPYAVRELGRGGVGYDGQDKRLLYRSLNIATWSQMFGMAACEGSLLFLYKKTKMLIFLLVFIINGVCVVFSQLTFAIIFSSSIILFVLINTRKTSNYHNRLIMLLVCSVVVWLYKKPLIHFLYDFVKKYDLGKLNDRIKNIYTLVVNHKSEGDANARFELYTKSIDTFKENPLGIFWKADCHNAIGFHSEVFDFVGTLGVIGIIVLGILVGMYYYKIRKIENKYNRRFYTIMCLLFFILAFVNPIFYSPQIWLSALLLPIMAMSYMPKKYREKHVLCTNDNVSIFT